MNYRHLYHAGSFADVIKHIILTLLLQQFLKKETGFCFVDTHAGLGLYDLGSDAAQTTQEYLTGVLRLETMTDNIPEWLLPYWKIIKSYNSSSPYPIPQAGGGRLKLYPGSPVIARALLRPQDKMILNEKHEETYKELKNFFHRDSQVITHQRDAYEFLPSILPFDKYGRALVLIDPPFEKTSEQIDLTAALTKTLKRFSHGVFAIWFPLTEKIPHLELNKELKALLPSEKNLAFEFSIADSTSIAKGLIGCAMLIINPPWQFKEALQEVLPILWNVLSIRVQGNWRIFSIN